MTSPTPPPMPPMPPVQPMPPMPDARPWPVTTRNQVAALIERARARNGRAAAHGGGTTVIALEGPSGAGKSTLTAGLAEVLRPEETAVIHMEDLYPGWDGLRAATVRLTDDILPELRRGRPARWRRWDWAADRYGSGEDVVPARAVTVVEGVGSGCLAAASMIDALVLVDAPERVRYARAMARDGATYAAQWDRWAAQERAYLVEDHVAERADLVVFTASPQISPLA